MKGFLYNDIKRLIVSLLIRNKNKEIVKAIKTHVTKYGEFEFDNNRFLVFYKGKWIFNTYCIPFQTRLKRIYIAPSYYFSKSQNATQISTINGQIYIFENNVLKPIEHYGYNMKTWNDMYNYFKKHWKNK